MSRWSGGRPGWAWLTATCLAASVTVFVLTSTTESGWSSAAINNTANSGVIGALAFQHVGTAGCSAGPAASSTTSCPGTVVPTSATSSAGAVTGTDAITDNGTIAAAQLTQTVQAPSCRPVQFADTKTASDPMLPRYSTAFQQADKWGTSTAVGLNGSAYTADVTSTATATPVSVGVWFKVAGGYSNGGGLISLGASPANAASATPPVAVWMNAAGKVSVYVDGNGMQSSTVTTSAAYNDGSWHLAVLSVTTGHSSPTLYLDGVAISATIFTPGSGVTGFWHVGWVDPTGLAGAPASATLTGSLSGAFVTNSAVSQANVTALYAASSAASYSTAVLALTGVIHLWMLGDSGTTTYAGALLSPMTAPCSQVDVTFSFSNPSASIAKQSLAAFANGAATTIATPGPGTTQTMTVSLGRGATYNAAIAGLHLYAPLTVTEKASSSSTWSLSFTWTGAQAVFLT